MNSTDRDITKIYSTVLTPYFLLIVLRVSQLFLDGVDGRVLADFTWAEVSPSAKETHKYDIFCAVEY